MGWAISCDRILVELFRMFYPVAWIANWCHSSFADPGFLCIDKVNIRKKYA